MCWKKTISMIASLFLIFTSACSLPMGSIAATEPAQDPTAAIQTEVAQIVASTAAAQTALANALASTLTAMPTDTLQATFTPSLTDTPSFTFTPSITPTFTFTPTLTFTTTSEVPMVSVSVQTNCRSGPGTAYDILGIMNVGQSAQVVGRSAASDNWIIKLPSNPAITCWMWGQYATVVGNIAGLPVIPPPPTPTPAASFIVVYSAIEDCGGGVWALKFKITNNGSITWESNRVLATDTVTTESHTISFDNFPNVNEIGCATMSADLNLDPGEVGHTTSWVFLANPAGHAFTATIRVCSLDGLAGTCLDKTITFTP